MTRRRPSTGADSRANDYGLGRLQARVAVRNLANGFAPTATEASLTRKSLFEQLPEATLAAVVIAAVIELVDIPALVRLYRVWTGNLGGIYGWAARADPQRGTPND